MNEAVEAAVIVAHPDDETLWAGGVILSRPGWGWTIVTLCRKSDRDRAPKFARVLERLGATGGMADMDDGPDQTPLSIDEVKRTVLALLPERRYDVIVTHSPFGEYTRHRRHEEVSEAVTSLWRVGELECRELWLFAYDDDGRRRPPAAIERADVRCDLDRETYRIKRDIMINLYGFATDSWEAGATRDREAFWCCRTPQDYHSWLAGEGKHR